jgi:enoyl-CoA hydratase/carnithine racemase
MGDDICYSVANGIGQITLDRPDSYNYLNNELLEDFLTILEEARADDHLKAVSISGSGGNFCAGAETSMFREAVENNDRATVDRFIGRIHRVTRELEELAVPVLAVVEGYALAGGLELLLACDLRLAAEDAQFGDEHTKYGLVPGGGATQRLYRQLDTVRANELVFTDRRLSGEEAQAYGLVTKSVPPDQLAEEAAALESSLARRSRASVEMTKDLIREGNSIPKRQGLVLERQAVVKHYFTEDAKRGFRALTENRRPEF